MAKNEKRGSLVFVSRATHCALRKICGPKIHRTFDEILLTASSDCFDTEHRWNNKQHHICLGDIQNMPTFWVLALFGNFYNFCFDVQIDEAPV